MRWMRALTLVRQSQPLPPLGGETQGCQDLPEADPWSQPRAHS